MADVDPALEAMRAQVLAAGKARRPVRVRGAGTKDFLGGTPAGEILDTRSLEGIVDYEPSELVVTARAGTRLSVLEAALREHGQFLAFEPPAFDGDPTIGGVVATGLAGPRRASAGGVRDFVLGARLMGTNGEVLTFGGQVMKNVAGFDVSRLLCGSWGILGLITEVSLKVLPQPACEATVSFEMTAEQALAAFNRWSRQSWPLSATSWCDGLARIRLSGVAAVVEGAVTALGGARALPEEATSSWHGLRHHRDGFWGRRVPTWRLSVPSVAPLAALPGPMLIEWAGALRWLRTDAAAAEVLDAARAVGGSAALWHGGAPSATPLSAQLLAIHRRLKDAFDPAGLFNPGRLVPEL